MSRFACASSSMFLEPAPPALRALLCALLLLASAGCGDDGGEGDTPSSDGGPRVDGGPPPDGGARDGGAGEDGGARDGGALPGDGGADGGLPGADGGPMPFTEAQVQALFNTRGCTGGPCHDASSPQLGLDLTDFAAETVGMASTQSDLALIEPGDHEASYLWHKVNGTHTVPPASGSGMRMPRGGTPLTATEISRLAAYIDAL